LAEVIQSTLIYNAQLGAAMKQVSQLSAQVNTLANSFNYLDAAARKSQAVLAANFAAGLGTIPGLVTQQVRLVTATENFGKAIQKNTLSARQNFAEALRGYKLQSKVTELAKQQLRYRQAMVTTVGRTGGGAARGLVTTQQLLDMSNMNTRVAMLNERLTITNHLIKTGATQIVNFGKNMQWTGRQLTVGLAMPVLIFGGIFAKVFMDLDKEITRFKKVYGNDLKDTINSSTDTMIAKVKELSAEIAKNYGIAMKDTAALAADIAQTGQEGQKLLNSVAQTTRLAILGEVDRQEAMKATLAIQSAFGVSTNELADKINFLNAVENQTSTSLQDLVEAIPRTGPVIRGLGGDIEDLAVMMVAMREGGVGAAEAANAIKSGMASMINPTKKAAEVAKGFGVDLVSIVEANKGQLMPMLIGLKSELDKLDSFSRSRVIEELFGKYQFARISALFNNLGSFGSQTQKVMELAGASTVELAAIANKELKAIQESATVRFQRAMQEIQIQLIPLGESLLNIFMPIAQILNGVINKVKEIWSSMPDPLKNLLGNLFKYGGGAVIVAGPVLMLIGLFSNLLGNAIQLVRIFGNFLLKLRGMKIGKLEILDAEIAAANAQTQLMNTTLTTQQTIYTGINKELQLYINNLKTLAIQNPRLFVPPGAGFRAPMAPPLSAASTAQRVLHRADGSKSPEGGVPGTGRGDKIPALLEPGEFVVNRNATNRYAPILAAMNAGTLQGFVKGTKGGSGSISMEGFDRSHLTSSISVLIQDLLKLDGIANFLRKSLESMYAAGERVVKVYSNLAVMLPREMNLEFERNQGVSKIELTTALQTQEAWRLTMAQTGLAFDDLKPFIDRVVTALNGFQGELITSEMIYQTVETELADLARSSDVAGQKLVTLASQYGTVAAMGAGGKMGREQLLIKDPVTGAVTVGGPSYKRSEYGQADKPYAKWLPFNYGSGVLPSSLSGQGVSPNQTYRPQSAQFRTIEEVSKQERIAKADASILKFKQAQEKHNRQISFSTAQIANIEYGMSQALRDKNGRILVNINNWDKGTDGIWRNTTTTEQATGRTAARLKRYDELVALRTEEERKLFASVQLAERYQTSIDKTLLRIDGILAADERERALNLKLVEDEQKEQMRINAAARKEAIAREKAAAIAQRKQSNSGIFGNAGMNALMGVSMMTGLVGATGALGQFSNALMLATTGLMTLSIFGPGIKTLQGRMGSAGKGFIEKGRQPFLASKINDARMARGSSLPMLQGAGKMAKLGGAASMGLGALMSFASTGWGLAIVAAIGGIVAGFILMRNAAEEARKRTVAAFNDPLKTAEYFEVKITSITDQMKQMNIEKAMKTNVSKIDQGLIDAVKVDYENLITKLKYSTATAGARELSITFQNMLAAGLSSEKARAAIKAISVAAGVVGGEAYAQAVEQGLLKATDPKERPAMLIKQFGEQNNKELIRQLESRLKVQYDLVSGVERYGANLLDNWAGATLSGISSVVMNTMKGIVGGLTGGAVDLAKAGPDWLTRSFDYDEMQRQIKANADLQRAISESEQQLLEATDITATQLVEISKQLNLMFKEAPREAIDAFLQLKEMAQTSSAVPFEPKAMQDFVKELDPLSGPILAGLIATEDQAWKVAEALTAGLSVVEIVSAIVKDELDYRINVSVNYREAMNAIEDLKKSLEDSLGKDITEKIDRVKNSLDTLKQDKQDYIDQRAIDKQAAEDEYQTEQTEIEDTIKLIDKSTAKYVKNLQKKKAADDFYSRQKQTGLGALGKLASGDIFGFIMDRQQMVADAANFAYDQELSKIEDRKNAKIDALNEEKELESRLHQQKMDDFDTITQRIIDQKQETIDAKSAELGELKTLQDSFDAGRMLSATELSKFLKEKEIAPIIAAQREIIKKQFIAEYMAGKSKTEAFKNVYPLLKQLFPLSAIELSGMLSQGGTEAAYYQGLLGITRLAETFSTKKPHQAAPEDRRRVSTTKIISKDNFNPTTFYGKKVIMVYRDGFGNDYYQDYVWDKKQKQNIANGDPRPAPRQAAEGGYISGPGTQTSDSIPARLSNGEYVIKASSVSKYGKNFLDNVNEGKLGFGNGGYMMPQKFYAGGLGTAGKGSVAFGQSYNSSKLFQSEAFLGESATWSPFAYDLISLYHRGASYRKDVITPKKTQLPWQARKTFRTGGLAGQDGGGSNSQYGMRYDPTNPNSFNTSQFNTSAGSPELANAIWTGLRTGAAGLFQSVVTGDLSSQDPVANFIGGDTYANMTPGEKSIEALLGASNFIPIPGIAGIKALVSAGKVAKFAKAAGMGLKDSLSLGKKAFSSSLASNRARLIATRAMSQSGRYGKSKKRKIYHDKEILLDKDSLKQINSELIRRGDSVISANDPNLYDESTRTYSYPDGNAIRFYIDPNIVDDFPEIEKLIVGTTDTFATGAWGDITAKYANSYEKPVYFIDRAQYYSIVKDALSLNSPSDAIRLIETKRNSSKEFSDLIDAYIETDLLPQYVGVDPDDWGRKFRQMVKGSEKFGGWNAGQDVFDNPTFSGTQLNFYDKRGNPDFNALSTMSLFSHEMGHAYDYGIGYQSLLSSAKRKRTSAATEVTAESSRFAFENELRQILGLPPKAKSITWDMPMGPYNPFKYGGKPYSARSTDNAYDTTLFRYSYSTKMIDALFNRNSKYLSSELTGTKFIEMPDYSLADKLRIIGNLAVWTGKGTADYWSHGVWKYGNKIEKIRAALALISGFGLPIYHAGIALGGKKEDRPNEGEFSPDLSKILKANGGMISGPGTKLSDSIPAMLSNGEYVIKASSVDKYGVPFMDSLNAGRFMAGGMASSIKKYADGGYVGSYGSSNYNDSNSSMYNITVNAGSVSDPDKLAEIIVSKINFENSRRQHARSI